MSHKLHCPLWMHSPGAACVIAIATLLGRTHLPARVPMQFDWSGAPVRWGSPIEAWLSMFGIAVAILIGSAVLDEVFARHESRRRFNFLSVIGDAILGIMLGMTMEFVSQLSASHPVFTFPWKLMAICGGGAVLAGSVLECFRPHRPASLPAAESYDISSADAERIRRAADNWLYWEAQNPVYLRYLIPLVTLLMMTGAVAVFGTLPWLVPVFVVAVLVMLLLYGGMRVVVTPRQLRVKLGLLGIPLRSVAFDKVAAVEVVSFSPLADFGGWGIRYSLRLKAWGYFLSGRQGVKVQTRIGGSFIVGSYTPERLAAYCQTAMSGAGQAA